MNLKIQRFVTTKNLISAKIEKIASTTKLYSISSFVMLSVLFPVAYASGPTDSINTQTPVKFDSALSLNTSSIAMVESKTNISQIVPGESLVQKEAREKAEAEAKAKAQAQAQAQQAAASRNTVSRESRTYSDPSNFDEIYKRAENAYGVDARLLRAVHQTETGGSGSTMISSYAGAQGPMQFLPSTWRHYGVDGSGDGVADIGNVEDAIFTAAKYLKACGYPNVQKALWGYNPSTSYYNKVMSKARSYGFNG